MYILIEYIGLFREDSFIDFVRRNVPATFLLDPTPSSRNVKFQTDPLIVVLIAVSRANRPKHAPRFILMNWVIKVEHNNYYTFFGCNYDIFSQFLLNSWLEKIYNFQLKRNIKQQNTYPLNISETFLWPKLMSFPLTE